MVKTSFELESTHVPGFPVLSRGLVPSQLWVEPRGGAPGGGAGRAGGGPRLDSTFNLTPRDLGA